MSEKILGIGFIGCGNIARHHASAWRERKDAAIVHCADIDEERAKTFAQNFGVPRWSTDWHEVVDNPEVDVVVVCTPTHAHPQPVIAAAEAKKHILCEKPIALTLEDADRMLEATRRNGVKFGIGFQRRFWGQWTKLRQLIHDGVIGRPVTWRVMDATSGPLHDWFMFADKGGGPFIDLAVHHYDIARTFFGEAKWVLASVKNIKGRGDAPDTGTAIIEFEHGDQLVLGLSWGLPGKGHGTCRAGWLSDLLGPEGAIIPGKGKFIIRKPEGESEEPFEATPPEELFRRQVDAFVRAIAEDGEPEATGIDGRKALEIGLAVLESSRRGEKVSLPLEKGG